MTYAIVLLTTLSVLSLADIIRAKAYREETVKCIIQVIAWIPVVAISMFRYKVGTDYALYMSYFEAVMKGRSTVWGSSVEIDKGLYYFNKFFQIN